MSVQNASSNFYHSRNGFSKYTKTTDRLVYSNMVGNYSKEWRKCFRIATSFRVKKSPNILDLATQDSKSYGQSQ